MADEKDIAGKKDVADKKENIDRRLLNVVARRIANLSAADWKSASPEKRQPYRQAAARALRTISAYERRKSGAGSIAE